MTSLTWQRYVRGVGFMDLARWSGGPYVEILNADGEAVDVVNVFDYEKGYSVDLNEVNRRVNEYLEYA
jgi:hypothetical protein